MNGLLGKILNHRMLAEELNTKEVSRSWVDIVPNVVKLINQYFSHEPIKFNEKDIDFSCSGEACDILPIGTKVRVQLDNPVSAVDEKDKLIGRFRQGDIRWTTKVKTITDYFFRPDFPPMYQVDKNMNVAYTRNQLQVVKENEMKPSTKGQRNFIVEKLVRRFKKGNRIYFEVKWEGYDAKDNTNELRSELMKTIPEVVKEYENNNK